jgi:hypothetical protein
MSSARAADRAGGVRRYISVMRAGRRTIYPNQSGGSSRVRVEDRDLLSGFAVCFGGRDAEYVMLARGTVRGENWRKEEAAARRQQDQIITRRAIKMGDLQ